MNITLYELDKVKEDYTRVICVCRYQGKYLFSYNKKREGWEVPGGHIEEGESWEEAAKREMYEETGATNIKLTPICAYKITTLGILCYCEILELKELPKEYEMSEIMLSEQLPDNLTFPESSTLFFNTVKERMNWK